MGNDGSPQNPNRWQAWSYVLIQGVLLVLLVFLHRTLGPQLHRLILTGFVIEWLGIVGILVCAASLRRSLTVVPLPKEGGKLSTSGLYRYVRHPMYTSVLLFSLGVAIESGSVIKYCLVLALFTLFYFKSVYEEKYLALKYSDYDQYSSRIPRFIPFTKGKN